jgi:hypothetical protein
MGAPNDPNATMDKTAAAQPHASHESPIIYQGEEDIMFQAVMSSSAPRGHVTTSHSGGSRKCQYAKPQP